MMSERILGDREKAMEDSYFREKDAALISKLRKEAGLDEIAMALRDKLQVDNPELLARAREVGVTADTAAALFAAPLVQVAWAGGGVDASEREAVLRLARGRGVEPGTPAYAQLIEWLNERPGDALFDTAVEVIQAGFSVLPPAERDERIKRVVDACREVAEASGSELARLIGLGDGVSKSETAVLNAINAKLRVRH